MTLEETDSGTVNLTECPFCHAGLEGANTASHFPCEKAKAALRGGEDHAS